MASHTGKITHLTTVHPPFDTRIFHKEGKTLVRAGYQVALIVQHERDETTDGVKMLALPKSRGRLGRIFGLAQNAFHLALQTEADLYHFHDPELLPWAVRLRQKTGRPVVYDVHEDVRLQVRDKEWLPGWSRPWMARITGWIEDYCAKRVDAIVAATPAIARRFANHPRCIVVQNFPWREEFAPLPIETGGRHHGLFAYVGGISKLRGVREMITALTLAGPGARLALAGQWESAALRAECSQLPGWTQVEELGFLDREAVRQVLHRAQAGMVLFHPLGNHMESQPNKLFEYMSAGLPVIASDFPLWRPLVETARCGLVVNPLDPEAIAAAMRWVLAHPEEAQAMGNRGRQAVKEHYHWEKELPKLLDLYYSLVDQKRMRARAA